MKAGGCKLENGLLLGWDVGLLNFGGVCSGVGDGWCAVGVNVECGFSVHVLQYVLRGKVDGCSLGGFYVG